MKKVFVLISILLFSANCFAKDMNKQYTIKKGIVAVEYIPYNGGVFIYAEGINKKFVPLLDIVDYAASSFVGVAVDKSYYNLRDSGGVSYSYSIDDNVLSITYNIKKKIQLVATYEILKKNVIDVKYIVKNIDEQKHSVSVKSIYDTVLGEGKDGSYLTAVKNSINSEYIISDFTKHKYVTSTDGKLAIRFLFDEIYQKHAYKTVIAAKPFFESSVFEGRFIEGRGFNTVLSYNNSCIGCFFKTLKLNAGDEKIIEQKIQVLRNEFTVPENEKDDGFEEVSNGDEEYYSSTEIKPAEDVVSDKVNLEDIPIKEENTAVINDFGAQADFTVSKENQMPETSEVKKASSYSKEDVLALLEKINALKDDGSNTSQEEVLKLQIELENVLKNLKKK